MWTPYYGHSLNLTKLSSGQYPPHKSHVVSCFANSCKLAIIINDVIVQLFLEEVGLLPKHPSLTSNPALHSGVRIRLHTYDMIQARSQLSAHHLISYHKSTSQFLIPLKAFGLLTDLKSVILYHRHSRSPSVLVYSHILPTLCRCLSEH